MELKYKRLYKTVLKEYQKMSKCARVKVAALIVKDGRILSCGYNGTPAGQINCNELFKTENGKFYARNTITNDWLEYTEAEWKNLHHIFADTNEIHAEMNAIAQAYRNNLQIDKDCTMIVSTMPCENCAKLIFSVGIKNIAFVNEYDRGKNAIDFFNKTGINIEKI